MLEISKNLKLVVSAFDMELHSFDISNENNLVNIILDTLLNNENCQHAELVLESSVSDRVVIATFVKQTAIAMRDDELINDSMWVLKQGVKQNERRRNQK